MPYAIKNYPPNAGRPLEGYEDFHEWLMRASFHNACEGTSEMGLASDCEYSAAEVAVENNWSFWQIKQAHEAVKPLVAFDDLMQKIMNKLKAK